MLAKEIIGSFFESLGPQLAEVKEITERKRGEMDNMLAQIEQKEKETMATIAEQYSELAEMKLKLEKLERSLTKPEPMLRSQSNVEEIKGIGYGKGAELKEIGITNVGEFIWQTPKLSQRKWDLLKRQRRSCKGELNFRWFRVLRKVTFPFWQNSKSRIETASLNKTRLNSARR